MASETKVADQPAGNRKKGVDRYDSEIKLMMERLSQMRARRSDALAKEKKVARLEERQRNADELRMLGNLCKAAGFDGYRQKNQGGQVETAVPTLDTPLIMGALLLLAEQLQGVPQETLRELRQRGGSLAMQVEAGMRRRMQ